MDAHSDRCESPPCNPQAPGKIRKALKLFSKRKPGSGVASIFSMHVKGEGGLKSNPSSSKILTEPVAPEGEAEAESVDVDQEDRHKEDTALDELTSMKNNLESTSTRQSFSSLTSAKSLSFLSMLRWNRKRGGGDREAQTEPHKSGLQRKGIKSLFGSVHWHRKYKEEEDDILPDPPLLASRSNSVEIMKENLTLTPRPAHHSTYESEFNQQHPPLEEDHVTPEISNKVSGADKTSNNDRLSTVLGNTSSILSLDSLSVGGDIAADWVKVSSDLGVNIGTCEAMKKELALLAPKSTISVHTISSTSSTMPSSTAKFIFSSSPPKSIPNSTINQNISPSSTPSPTTSILVSPDFLPSPPPYTIPAPIIMPMFSQTTTNLTKPTINPTSPLTPEPSPEPSPTLSPPTISKTLTSPSEKPQESAFAIIPEPTHSLSQTHKPTPTAVPTSIRPIYSVVSNTKHSSAPVTKYPPFITSTKPVSTAPVLRPKIVTTFGLSTSRNTAPIIKPELKQSAHQIKSGTYQSQNEKNWSGLVSKASHTEPHTIVKHMFSTSNQPNPETSSGTPENPPYKPEFGYNSLPIGSALNIAPSYYPRGEKWQKEVASSRVVEDIQSDFSYNPERKTLVMKPSTLSKIPVSRGGRSKQYHKDAQSNGEERQCNISTPVHEEETLISLTHESISKDALSDNSTESGAISPALSYNNEDMVNPTISTVSIHRESKIPIKAASTTTYHSLQGKTEVARSKIPVAKVPICQSSNKTGPAFSDGATRK